MNYYEKGKPKSTEPVEIHPWDLLAKNQECGTRGVRVNFVHPEKPWVGGVVINQFNSQFLCN